MSVATVVQPSEAKISVKHRDAPATPLPVTVPAPTRSQLLKEYTEACANMRHYGNARLTRLVMFLALNGGLLNLLFTHQATAPRDMIMVAKVAAAFVTVLFGIVDYNIVVHFRWFNARARTVEAAIGLQQYTLRQAQRDKWPHNLINETHATWLMYVTVYFFWIYCLAAH